MNAQPPGLPQLACGRRLVLRPLAPDDADELVRILATPEVARWWGPVPEGFPLGDDDEAGRFTILVAGAVSGLVQFSEELDPGYRHARIDIFLDPKLHGRGLGSEAVRCLARYLIGERGHHRITIDPAAANLAAIRAYAKVGFKPVGLMRRYERDPGAEGWHDGLLMDLLAGELVEG
jgi:aminoglycoside 6'-N-acetyltransferase